MRWGSEVSESFGAARTWSRCKPVGLIVGLSRLETILTQHAS